MKKAIARVLAAVLILAAGALNHAIGQDASFDIVRFQIEGNSILPAQRAQELVAPFVGQRRNYGDVQKALEALEDEFRRLGYGTVQVYVPEQELTTGVVRLQVSEGVIGKVTITGNKYFNDANVRAGVPDLKEGVAPNMRKLSENVQLSNENPAKQVEVTLGVSEEEGKVNARVEVKEEDPDRLYLTLDNTGTKASGKHRLGVAYQNANLGNSDQVLTLAYTTALDPPGGMKILGNRVLPWQDGNGVKVDIFSIGYRLPLYALGDSIDFIYGNSSTDTPSTSPTLGTGLGINGKGEVFGFRYNHIFPRAGEFTSKLVLGLDYKYLNSRCAINGNPTPFGLAGCTPHTFRPVSATYSGQWQKPGEAIDFNVGLVHHLFPMGSRFDYAAAPGGNDRYSAASGYQTKDEFTALRFGGSYTTALTGDWLLRIAASGQHANNALPAGERLGVAGSTAVRGFLERAVAVDRGYFANIEAYSPDIAARLGVPGNLKWLVFYDFAQGSNLNPSVNQQVNIASLGVGLRYNINKDVSARLDIARVMDGVWPNGAPSIALEGDIRGHFGIAYGF
ncbi:ShlB/FhaC/HecB family hemolysin secretion/activation protein [Sulfuritalea sp.]|uniref:ShlB/FhaC/HecB family hemolysin secretion/activation protein n=1 Tax=Sulfuritalea sp. TaxID=2480090 RepID=UPI00286DC61F|nr:ShlB/FhaC/HecB family hemolysin secretion/activation protein [Sulfuritalea sp.]